MWKLLAPGVGLVDVLTPDVDAMGWLAEIKKIVLNKGHMSFWHPSSITFSIFVHVKHIDITNDTFGLVEIISCTPDG
jgi:hypothetical protein